MRQSVQALAVVTLDVPAHLAADVLPDTIGYALSEMDFKRVWPTGCKVLAVREEAAMFNSNGDQWETDPEKPWHLHKGDERFSVAADFGADAKEPARIARDVAEALNFMAGRGAPAPEPRPDYSAQMLAMLDMVLDVCDMADPNHENFADSGADCLQVIFDNEEKLRALVAKVKVAGK